MWSLAQSQGDMEKMKAKEKFSPDSFASDNLQIDKTLSRSFFIASVFFWAN